MSKALLKSNRVVLFFEQTKLVTKSRAVTKLAAVDLEVIKPCWERFNLDSEK
jgi:hypothetical protein